MAEWPLPWSSRGPSGAVSDNFLWKSSSLYVMDNHRLAVWCWWQHLDESRVWDYVHVDRHFDALWQTANPWPKHFVAAHRKDLESFRTAAFVDGGEKMALYRWDTITSTLLSLHRDRIGKVVFATADEGDPPLLGRAQHVRPWNLPGTLAWLASTDEQLQSPVILDIDIDYFTHHDLDGAFGQVFSAEYIGEVGQHLCDGLARGRFGVVTIALSPDTTGSWMLAERVLSLMLEHFPEYAHFNGGKPPKA